MLLSTAMPFLATLFVAAPIAVLPLLDESARLDLIDLYEAGMTAQAGNRYGGVSTMTEYSDSLIRIRMTAASDFEMRLLPDSTIVVTRTMTTPDDTTTITKHYDREFKTRD